MVKTTKFEPLPEKPKPPWKIIERNGCFEIVDQNEVNWVKHKASGYRLVFSTREGAVKYAKEHGVEIA